MVGPTLFDVIAITGLSPLGEVILSNMSPFKGEYTIDLEPATYSTFIEANMGGHADLITDNEYVTFLFYWLNGCVFYSRLVQIWGFCLPLAILLYEGWDLCLAKLLITHLYDAMGNIVKEIREHKKSINLGGLFWLL